MIASFFCRRLHFSFAYAKHAFSYLVGARKYCTFGARNAARNRAGRDGNVANSSSDRRQVGRQKDPQRSAVTNGSKPLAGIDGRSARVRRFESNISDLGGETLQCRQAPSANVPPVLTVELERLEAKFALAGEGRSTWR
jgi:hypothetical protein